jgi:hypothetical protein
MVKVLHGSFHRCRLQKRFLILLIFASLASFGDPQGVLPASCSTPCYYAQSVIPFSVLSAGDCYCFPLESVSQCSACLVTLNPPFASSLGQLLSDCSAALSPPNDGPTPELPPPPCAAPRPGSEVTIPIIPAATSSSSDTSTAIPTSPIATQVIATSAYVTQSGSSIPATQTTTITPSFSSTIPILNADSTNTNNAITDNSRSTTSSSETQGGSATDDSLSNTMIIVTQETTPSTEADSTSSSSSESGVKQSTSATVTNNSPSLSATMSIPTQEVTTSSTSSARSFATRRLSLMQGNSLYLYKFLAVVVEILLNLMV